MQTRNGLPRDTPKDCKAASSACLQVPALPKSGRDQSRVSSMGRLRSQIAITAGLPWSAPFGDRER